MAPNVCSQRPCAEAAATGECFSVYSSVIKKNVSVWKINGPGFWTFTEMVCIFCFCKATRMLLLESLSRQWTLLLRKAAGHHFGWQGKPAHFIRLHFLGSGSQVGSSSLKVAAISPWLIHQPDFFMFPFRLSDSQQDWRYWGKPRTWWFACSPVLCWNWMNCINGL